MAFQKTFVMPSGVSGNYIRLVANRWDRQSREGVAWFALFVDAASAQAGKQPLSPFIAKLWLTGPEIDLYLGRTALENADIIAQFYLAAKHEQISCDFGSRAFADAIDV